MKVKYDEGAAAVTVPGVGRVERGKPCEVSEETGKRLLRQGWKKAGGGSRTSKKKKAPEPASSAPATPEPTTNQGD